MWQGAYQGAKYEYMAQRGYVIHVYGVQVHMTSVDDSWKSVLQPRMTAMCPPQATNREIGKAIWEEHLFNT